MQITQLKKHGIRDSIIEMWQSMGVNTLLPIQAKAVRHGKILDGQNAVVFAPTSAGKTFVGEMAAIRQASQLQRVFYLVPQKALAEEKYREFRDRYKSFGISVVISTRDRRDFDTRIHRGEFHIAVVVFEKMQSLLVTNPGLLDKVGLVVADELQMVGDSTRGAGLEILLTKILLAKSKLQIIGLSAVLGNAEDVAHWMNATLCETRERPVELRKGVLHSGNLRYIEHNSGRESNEALSQCDSTNTTEVLVNQVCDFVDNGEQCIVFCKSRKDTQRLTAIIAEAIDAPAADKAIADLVDLEESENRSLLLDLLKNGVAYHNADLDWDQRDVIERQFRSGDISVVCATSTLALGVNMPSKNVFLDYERWNRGSKGRWGKTNISQAEYENISGRAGRLGLEKDFGRAILVAGNGFHAESLFDQYVCGELGDLEPALADAPLAQHVLNLVASKMARTIQEVETILLSSYTGQRFWRDQTEQVTVWIDLAIQNCIDGGLIEAKDQNLDATEVGRLAASKGVQVETAIQMKRFLEANASAATDITPFEVLFHLTGTKNGDSTYIGLSTYEHTHGSYFQGLRVAVRNLPEHARNRIMDDYEEMANTSYDNCHRAKKMLVLHDWILGRGNRDIETGYSCYLGMIEGLAGEFAWLMETLASMAKVMGWPEEAVEQLNALTHQLLHGVTAEGIELAKLRTRGFARGRIMGLVKQGTTTVEGVLELAGDALKKIVTQNVADRICQIGRRLLQIQEIEETRSEDGGQEPGDSVETPESVEWEEEFAPSDDMGTSYKADVAIVVDGRPDKRRYLVSIDGVDVPLTDKSFEVFLTLTVKATTDDLGWVNSTEIDDFAAYHQTIRRLRGQIQEAGVEVDPEALIENDTCKRYRLSVPPQRIEIDQETILRHNSALKKMFPKQTTA